MLTRLSICLGIVMLAAMAFAQPDPNNPGAGGVRDNRNNPLRELQMFAYVINLAQNPPTVVETTAQGVFIYRNGVLAQFANGKAAPQRLFELFDPMPELPAFDAPLDQKRLYLEEMQKRLVPVVMLIDDKKVVIASDTHLFAIDLTTFKPICQVALPGLNIAPGANPPPVAGARQPVIGVNNFAPMLPTVTVQGNLAYLIRGAQMTTVDIQAGKVLSNDPLPKIMTPQPVPLNDWIRAMRAPGGAPNDVFPAPPPPVGGAPNDVFPAPPPPVGGARDPQPENRVTLVGVVKRVNLEGGFWALEAEGGAKYVLGGAKLGELTRVANIDGARVRVIGVIFRGAGAAQYGEGTFNIAEYQVLR